MCNSLVMSGKSWGSACMKAKGLPEYSPGLAEPWDTQQSPLMGSNPDGVPSMVREFDDERNRVALHPRLILVTHDVWELG